MSRRRIIQASVLLIIGVLILYGLLRSVHPAAVGSALRGASLSWVALGELAFVLFVVIRGWRWLVILRASAPGATLGDATAVSAIGFAVNSVSPFKLGELLRIGAIAPRAGIGIGEAGATVVVERVLDVLALLVIAIAAAALSGAGSNSLGLWSGVLAITVASVLIALVGYLMVTYPDRTLATIDRIARRLPARLSRVVDNFAASVIRGFASLRSPRRLGAAALLSLIVWLCVVGGIAAFTRSLTGQLSLATLVLACAIFTISQAISITPGSVGTYEGFFLIVFSSFGARPASLITAIAVLAHVGSIAALLASGAIGALWLRLKRPPIPVRAKNAIAS